MSEVILKVGAFPLSDELKQAMEERGEFYIEDELSPEERAKVRQRTTIVLGSGGTQFKEADFATCPHLKGIVCYSVGYDGIDVPAVIKHNVFLTHTPDVLSNEVADTAMMLLLNCTRQAKSAQEYIENGQWGHAEPFPLTTSIEQKKIGIAGLGRIGKAIAQRAEAFNMRIGYYGRQPHHDVNYPFFGNLKLMAEWCDVLMLIMPATPENKHCVNLDVLKALGSKGYLINVARGSLVKTEDLITALDQNIIAGAALDVFENEPEVPAELMHRPNVVLLPHLGSATVETRHQMAELVVKNLDAIIQGQSVLTPVPGTRRH